MSRPFSLSDRSEVYLDDENAVTLTFNARNEGEGGAYEAELHVVMPSDADYTGIARNNEVRHMTSRQQCTRFNNLLNKDVLAGTEELVFISPQKQVNTSGWVMDVVFVSSPELHSADLQLWHWEPDPCVRSGKPHEVWYQCKKQTCPLRYVSLDFRPLNWSVTFLSCGSYGGAFGSLFPDWMTPTKLWRLSSRYEGGLLSKFRAVWRVKVKQRCFFF